jgi:hypothetical protein
MSRLPSTAIQKESKQQNQNRAGDLGGQPLRVETATSPCDQALNFHYRRFFFEMDPLPIGDVETARARTDQKLGAGRIESREERPAVKVTIPN